MAPIFQMFPLTWLCYLNNPLFCRWLQATKSTNQAMAAKVDSLKDEMDEALNKVEICKVDFMSTLSHEACCIRLGSYLMNWLNKEGFMRGNKSGH